MPKTKQEVVETIASYIAPVIAEIGALSIEDAEVVAQEVLASKDNVDAFPEPKDTLDSIVDSLMINGHMMSPNENTKKFAMAWLEKNSRQNVGGVA